jgi:predicted DNA-binding transcriptional regulator YafY
MKISRLSRVVRILTLLQSQRRYSANDLSDILAVSKRTIYRDLNELAAAGVPYRFNPGNGGYGIEPEYFLPPVNLNMPEALSLLTLVHKAKTHLPMPFRSAAIMAAVKVENNLPDQIKQYCSTVLKGISIKPDSHVPTDGLGKTFATLQSAIAKKRKVRMYYAPLGNNKNTIVTLSPYHLNYNNRAWYVIGLSGSHKELRTFKLSRIKQITVLDKCFVVKEKFTSSDYFGKAWSMIPEGRLYHIKLKFTKKVARNVSEVRWHSSQKATHHSDGAVTMDFVVDGLGEIRWWILGYGDQVEVLKPKALRDKIAKTAKEMAKINS